LPALTAGSTKTVPTELGPDILPLKDEPPAPTEEELDMAYEAMTKNATVTAATK